MITDFREAKRQIDATIAGQPKNHNLRMQAAEFYMKTGHYAEAIPQLKAATQLAPKIVLPWIALGDAATFADSYALAESAYAKAATMDPKNPFIFRGRGQLLLKQRRFAASQKTLEEGLRLNPQDVELRTALGNLYLILNRPRDTISMLSPVVARYPNRADLHFMLGEAYERDLHINAAIEHMQEVVRLDPQNASAWGRLGLYHVNLTRYKDARGPLLQAIQLEPKQSYYYWVLGDSYLLENPSEANFQEAARLYRQALALNPKNDKALYSFGMGLTRHGQPKDLEEAVGIFKRLVAIHPADMNAHYKLYETYRRLGRTQEAEAYRARFKDLFAKGRTQTRTLYAAAAFKDTPEVHLKLGKQAMSNKNYPLAVKEFQMVLDRAPGHKEAQQRLVEAQKLAGQNAGVGQP